MPQNIIRPFRAVFPKKGRLQKDFQAVMDAAGLETGRVNSRVDYGTTYDSLGDIEAFDTLVQRAGDALDNLDAGLADFAIVGLDTFEEASCRARNDGRELQARVSAAFNFSACALWIAAPDNAQIRNPSDLADLRIATSYPNILKAWLKNNDVENVTIIGREGGIEDYVRLGAADAICDIVDSGRTLEANGLTKTLKLFDSAAVIVERKGAWPEEFSALAQKIKIRLLAAEQRTRPDGTCRNRPGRRRRNIKTAVVP